MTRYLIIKSCREGEPGQKVTIPWRRAEALLKSGHIRPLDWTEKAMCKNG